MHTEVNYPPQNPGEYACVEKLIIGMIPVRIVVSKRIEGWCAYLLLKYMPLEFCLEYGDHPRQPIPWERVRDNGDKISEMYAESFFPEMKGFYVR